MPSPHLDIHDIPAEVREGLLLLQRRLEIPRAFSAEVEAEAVVGRMRDELAPRLEIRRSCCSSSTAVVRLVDAAPRVRLLCLGEASNVGRGCEVLAWLRATAGDELISSAS